MRRTVTIMATAVGCLTAGALAGYAASSDSTNAPPVTAAERKQPVEVRTEVIHRTVRVVRHEKRKHRRRRAAAPAVAAPPPRSVAPAATPSAAASTSAGSGSGSA